MNSAPFITSRDIPALWHLGLFFGGLGILYLALRRAKGIWIYILVTLEFGFFIGAGIGLSTFGGNALGIVDRYAKDNQDWLALSTTGAWGAAIAVVLTLMVAGVVNTTRRYRPRVSQAESAPPPTCPPDPPDAAASKTVDRLARDLALALGEPLDVRKLALLIPEEPGEPAVAWESIDYLALEMAPLYGQFGHALMSIGDDKKITITYPRGLVLREAELRLYLRHHRN